MASNVWTTVNCELWRISWLAKEPVVYSMEFVG